LVLRDVRHQAVWQISISVTENPAIFYPPPYSTLKMVATHSSAVTVPAHHTTRHQIAQH